MRYPFVDCQGLAGAWTLGTVQTGMFELAARRSLPGGFGDEPIGANRALVGRAWEQETGDAHEWSPVQAAFLCGTPPCSGFSGLNKNVEERGPGNPINSCMRELVTYAARCRGLDGRPGPEVVSFESVQGAFSKGRPLMLQLRDLLCAGTGERYELHHVLMSGATVGAAQMRHRYYPVFARVPFGVERPRRDELPDGRVVTYRDAIGDLEGADLRWDGQWYPHTPQTAYQRAHRGGCNILTAHVVMGGQGARLVEDVCERGWPPGLSLPKALRRLDYWPPGFERRRDSDDSYDGAYWPRRAHPGRPGWVLSGQGARSYVHWSENRYLTIRECARLMGYPDSWEWPTESASQASAWIGKCCPVGSGQWISGHVGLALGGMPGPRGDAIGHDEYLYNFTLLYREWLRDGGDGEGTGQLGDTQTRPERNAGPAGGRKRVTTARRAQESRPGPVVARPTNGMPAGVSFRGCFVGPGRKTIALAGQRVRHVGTGDEAVVVGFSARTDQVRLRRDDGRPTEWKPEKCVPSAPPPER